MFLQPKTSALKRSKSASASMVAKHGVWVCDAELRAYRNYKKMRSEGIQLVAEVCKQLNETMQTIETQSSLIDNATSVPKRSMRADETEATLNISNRCARMSNDDLSGTKVGPPPNRTETRYAGPHHRKLYSDNDCSDNVKHGTAMKRSQDINADLAESDGNYIEHLDETSSTEGSLKVPHPPDHNQPLNDEVCDDNAKDGNAMVSCEQSRENIAELAKSKGACSKTSQASSTRSRSTHFERKKSENPMSTANNDPAYGNASHGLSKMSIDDVSGAEVGPPSRTESCCAKPDADSDCSNNAKDGNAIVSCERSRENIAELAQSKEAGSKTSQASIANKSDGNMVKKSTHGRKKSKNLMSAANNESAYGNVTHGLSKMLNDDVSGDEVGPPSRTEPSYAGPDADSDCSDNAKDGHAVVSCEPSRENIAQLAKSKEAGSKTFQASIANKSDGSMAKKSTDGRNKSKNLMSTANNESAYGSVSHELSKMSSDEVSGAEVGPPTRTKSCCAKPDADSDCSDNAKDGNAMVSCERSRENIAELAQSKEAGSKTSQASIANKSDGSMAKTSTGGRKKSKNLMSTANNEPAYGNVTHGLSKMSNDRVSGAEFESPSDMDSFSIRGADPVSSFASHRSDYDEKMSDSSMAGKAEPNTCFIKAVPPFVSSSGHIIALKCICGRILHFKDDAGNLLTTHESANTSQCSNSHSSISTDNVSNPKSEPASKMHTPSAHHDRVQPKMPNSSTAGTAEPNICFEQLQAPFISCNGAIIELKCFCGRHLEYLDDSDSDSESSCTYSASLLTPREAARIFSCANASAAPSEQLSEETLYKSCTSTVSAVPTQAGGEQMLQAIDNELPLEKLSNANGNCQKNLQESKADEPIEKELEVEKQAMEGGSIVVTSTEPARATNKDLCLYMGLLLLTGLVLWALFGQHGASN